MAVLDIRNMSHEQITKIQWGKGDFIEIDKFSRYKITDFNSQYIFVLNEEIDHLIAALQKAKELWGPK